MLARLPKVPWSLVGLLLSACTPLETGSETSPCELALPPAAPGADTGDDGSEMPPLVWAARSLSTGIEKEASDQFEFEYRRYGFDLDGHCTRNGTDPGCVAPESFAEISDGPGGRDYGANLLAAENVLLGGGRIGDFTSAVNLDGGTLIVRVTGYNGRSTDRDVTVEAFWATLAHSRGTRGGARWDGSDVWLPFPHRSSDDGNDSVSVARRAYVSEGILVARFDEIWIRDSPFPPFPLFKVTLAGPLERNGDGVSLGRTDMASVVQLDVLLAEFAAVSERGIRCRPRAEYEIVRDVLCNYADIRARDNDATKPCDGLSSVVSISWSPARLGPPTEPPLPQLPPCEALSCE
ncbi:MAG: hypothetical protein OXU20_38940 [Myxococcales bacterium]|nr:hypothetical protein [Myxococcales bacterium]